jgi:hypothetical protein
VVVLAAVDISSVVLVMGDHFLGKKGIPGMMGVFGVVGLLNGELGCDMFGVLIHDCQMRTEIGSGLLSSDSDSYSMGSVSPACLSSE